jgi:hypothetical protein
MNIGALVVLVVVAAVVTASLRRMRMPAERRREAAERSSGTTKRIEAYSFPVLGVLIAIGALVYWEPWISIAGLAIGGLFLFAGIASLRDVRRGRVS